MNAGDMAGVTVEMTTVTLDQELTVVTAGGIVIGGTALVMRSLLGSAMTRLSGEDESTSGMSANHLESCAQATS
jgi:hypothetical protein